MKKCFLLALAAFAAPFYIVGAPFVTMRSWRTWNYVCAAKFEFMCLKHAFERILKEE